MVRSGELGSANVRETFFFESKMLHHALRAVVDAAAQCMFDRMKSGHRFILVDGHSVIHAWDDLRKLHMRSEKRHLAREELLKRMRLLQDMSGERVVVIFDGTSTKITDEREDDGIQIFYADTSHTADSIIERLVAKYGELHPIRVVTADRMIWETVRAFGAHWMSPDDLSFELDKAERELRGRLKQ